MAKEEDYLKLLLRKRKNMTYSESKALIGVGISLNKDWVRVSLNKGKYEFEILKNKYKWEAQSCLTSGS